MERRPGGYPVFAVRRHKWPPGEKALFARRNDLRSIRLALREARARRRRFDVERFGADGLAAVEREITELEDLHVEKIEALYAVEREYGFGPEHETVADPVIAADRQLIRDRIWGASVTAVALSLKAARRKADILLPDGTPKYPSAAQEVERLAKLVDRLVAADSYKT